jgi:hypothetical protein
MKNPRARVFAVYVRWKAPTAVLSLVLLAIEAVVGAVGHSHSHRPAVCDGAAASRQHGGSCGHDSHHAAPEKSTELPTAPDNSQHNPHDDCSLCRHFSQPVAPVAVILAVETSESCNAFVLPLVQRLVVLTTTTHAARGPPMVCA